MRRRHFGVGALAAACCLAVTTPKPRAEPSARTIMAREAPVELLGAWHTNETGYYTIYAGSRICFNLRGKAKILTATAAADPIRVVVRRAESKVWDGIVGKDGISLDGGTEAVPFSVIYVAGRDGGFDPAQPGAAGAELHFRGFEVEKDTVLSFARQRSRRLMLDFLGDSITVGDAILGSDGSWTNRSDATLTFGYLLAAKLDAQYRIRGFPGENCETILRKATSFRQGIPLSTNVPPDAVFVNIGANDRWTREGTLHHGMRTLVAGLLDAWPNTRVVLLNFHRMTPNRLPMLKAVAQSFPTGRVVCFDARPYLTGYSDERIHPDAESHSRLAAALAKYLATDLLRDRFDASQETGSASNAACLP
jgi:lysophospholipase L1-like esterase